MILSKMLCAHKQPYCSCKSSGSLLHVVKPMEMGLFSVSQGCLHPPPHLHPHPNLPALTAHLLTPPAAWPDPRVIPSPPLYCPAMELSWWEPPCLLKASAALGPLGCPSSVYSAVKFTVPPAPSPYRGTRYPLPNHSKTSYPNIGKWGCTGFWCSL